MITGIQIRVTAGVLLAAIGGGLIGRATVRRKPVEIPASEPLFPTAPLPPADEAVIPAVVKDHLADVSKKIAAATAKAVEAQQFARRAAAESTASCLAADAGRMAEAERRAAEAEYLQKRAERLWNTYVDCVAQIDSDRAIYAA